MCPMFKKGAIKMIVYEKILVAYDGSSHSEIALKKAAEFMAANDRVKTHVVHVLEPPHTDLYALYGVNISQAMMKQMNEGAEQTLAEAKDLLSDYKTNCSFKQLYGKVQQQILKYTEENDIELIIIGSRGLGTFKGMMLGSVSQFIVQQATCDVVVVK